MLDESGPLFGLMMAMTFEADEMLQGGKMQTDQD